MTQVIYLGGLGDDGQDLSEHLRSRSEVEHILMDSVPTTAFRAGIVIGDGSISWEILRQLVIRLPVMITPRWVETRTQPIALADALFYLMGVLGRQDMVGDTYEIGGPEPLTYRRMMTTVSRHLGHPEGDIPVPFLSPRLSSHWLRFITDVDLRTAQALVDSMSNEVVVHNPRINELLAHEPMSFEDGGQGRSEGRGLSHSNRVAAACTLDRRPREGSRIHGAVGSQARRHVSVAVTLVVGTALLATTLRAPSGSTTFFILGFLVAGIWILGSVISGPIPLEAIRSSRLATSLSGLALGIVAFLGFLTADLIGQHLPLISNALHNVLTKADAGPAVLVLTVALVNGVGEELFFRGALFSALGSHNPVAGTVVIYVAVTATTGNIALLFAATAMGIIFSLQRARQRGNSGFDRDASMLVNPHDSRISQVRAPRIGCTVNRCSVGQRRGR